MTGLLAPIVILPEEALPREDLWFILFMNCPHTWFSTELRGGRRLLRARLRDLLRPAPRRGRALALAAALALCAGALVACRTAPAEESNPPVLVEEEAAQVILRLSPAALGLEEGGLTLSEPFSVELGGTYYQEVLTWLTSRAVFTLY